jgi:ATP-dependent Lhr-like helicase
MWARLKPRNARPNGGGGEGRAAPVRSTPIALWRAPCAAVGRAVGEADTTRRARARKPSPSSSAIDGASFFDEIVDGSGLLRSQVEEALAELVALGLVTSDSFAGLRSLLVPSSERKPYAGGRRRRRTAAFGMEDAGRWALARPARQPRSARLASRKRSSTSRARCSSATACVFWRLLAREADWLPAVARPAAVYRKLESRGEIRGGRFVAGFSGEQFALIDAIAALRETRRAEHSGAFLSLSAPIRSTSSAS